MIMSDDDSDYDWDHQHDYSINEIIEISCQEASDDRNILLFDRLAEICVDMKLYGNASALDVYETIINNPSDYQSLTDAAIHCMRDDGYVGAAGRR